MASLSLSPAERESIEAFRRDVVEASLDKVVVVDFWAEWCGPCKQLTPILEKVVAATGGKATLVKIDTDKNQTLAAQFRIQSIPTVYGFVGGQPIDGFQGARSEREVKAFVDRLIAALPPAPEEADFDALVAAVRQALDEGAAEEAAEMAGALTREAPERADVIALYARALLATGQVDGARAALAALPVDVKDPAVAQARAALALAETAAPVDDLGGLARAVEAAPDDLAVRFELAGALAARGDRDPAADHLLEIIRRDRDWEDGKARARLLQLMEAIGLGDPWSSAQRRKLSAVLFT